MKITKAYEYNEYFVVVLWQTTDSATTRLRRHVTKHHALYESAQAEIGQLLETALRGTHATIERHYS